MGRAIKKFDWKRNDLVVTTKLNWGGHNGEVLVNNHGLSRKHIIEGLRASLDRLDLEYVDVVYAHRPDRLTPMEETVRAFNHVIEVKGWAMYWGTSEWAADEIAEACGIAKELGLIGPIVEQPMYNMLTRKKVEGEFQRLYKRFGLGLTTFSPINFGLLSGKYDDSPDQPPAGSRFAKGDDKFVSSVRDSFANEQWQKTIASAKQLKVSLYPTVDGDAEADNASAHCGQAGDHAGTACAGMVSEERERVCGDHGRIAAGAGGRELRVFTGVEQADARGAG